MAFLRLLLDQCGLECRQHRSGPAIVVGQHHQNHIQLRIEGQLSADARRAAIMSSAFNSRRQFDPATGIAENPPRYRNQALAHPVQPVPPDERAVQRRTPHCGKLRRADIEPARFGASLTLTCPEDGGALARIEWQAGD